MQKSRDHVSKEEEGSHNHKACTDKFNEELEKGGYDDESEHEQYKADSRS